MKKISIALLAALLCIAFVTSCSSLNTTGTKYLEDPDYPYLLITENGTVSANGRVFASYITEAKTLVIPDTLCGIKVTSIAASGFRDYIAIKEVVLPDTIVSIGSKAFYDCTGLTSISLNYGLKKIGSYAFYGCSALEFVAIPSTVTFVGATAFQGVPDSCTVIYASTDGFDDDWKTYSDATFTSYPKYTQDYHMNGAEGKIEATENTYGTAITLSTEVPVREGYTFAGWIIEGTDIVYQPGDTYIVPARNTHFLASWK